MAESKAKLSSKDLGTLPFDLTFSETTIHRSFDFDQMILNILFMMADIGSYEPEAVKPGSVTKREGLEVY